MIRLILAFLLAFSFLVAAPSIAVQNRILMKVAGKPISVMDVMKKMDLVFFREFPQYAESTEARYEFYTTNWRSFLEEMIDEQLILASAKELKVESTEGEVRQEIEEIFGPNVIANIDKANLTYAEVLQMVKDDMTVRRMVGSMVQAKAATEVTPARIQTAYEKYCADNPQEKTWEYQVLTIRSKVPLEAATAAHLIEERLSEKELSLEKLREELATRCPSVQCSLSDTLSRTPRTLSQSHRTGLQDLTEGQFSQPIDQSSGKEGIFRVFHLKRCVPERKIPYDDVETKLKTELLSDAMSAQSKAWRGRLRERFGIDDPYLKQMVPSSFKPFTLQGRAAL